MRRARPAEATAEQPSAQLKAMGFSDARLAKLARLDARPRCASARIALGVRPVFKRVDTCAAEFEAPTPYIYSTYERGCSSRRRGRVDEAEPSDAQQGR